jgi:hypothetical protein
MGTRQYWFKFQITNVKFQTITNKQNSKQGILLLGFRYYLLFGDWNLRFRGRYV